MPSYVKFMKDILLHKRKLENFDIVTLLKVCSEIIQRKLSPKLKDLGSVIILCNIGNAFCGKALYDVEASINLMSFFVFKQLGLGEPKSTIVSLQMADCSIKSPK